MSTRLTSNQKEALYAVVDNKVYPYMLKSTIPSLVKRDLVVTYQVGESPYYTTIYRLTPKGSELYIKLRSAQHENARFKLDTDYKSDISRAKNQAAEIAFKRERGWKI